MDAHYQRPSNQYPQLMFSWTTDKMKLIFLTTTSFLILLYMYNIYLVKMLYYLSVGWSCDGLTLSFAVVIGQLGRQF